MNARDRLDGWKEIAEYLNRSVKTAQRWEGELDLPVHRVGGASSSVFAFRSEIDGWLATSASAGNGDDAEEDSKSEAVLAHEQRPIAGIVVLGVMALVLLLAFLVGTLARPAGSPVGVVFRDEHVMVALDGAGEEIWRHVEPRPIAETIGNPRKLAALVVDFDGDGVNEVAAVFRDPRQGEGRVVGFSATGEVLWELSVGEAVTLDGVQYLDSYTMADLIPVRMDGQLWLAAMASHRPWFPSIVAWIRPATGEVFGQYVHAGYLFTGIPHDVDGDGSEELLVGGYNNLLASPVVAILEPIAGRTVSPGPDHWEPVAASGRERAYVRFNPSVVARDLGMASWVRTLRVSDDHIQVEIELEADRRVEERVYVLDLQLAIQRLEFPRAFRVFHARMSEEGRIAHAFAAEEEAGRVLERIIPRE